MSGGRRRGRAAAGADEDDEEDSSVLQKRGKSSATKKGGKDAAGAETAAETAAAEVESLAADAIAAAAKKKKPTPSPAKLAVTDPMIDFVKEHIFGRETGLSVMNRHHHKVSECFDLPCPSWKGMLLCERTPPHLTLLCGHAR